LQNTHTTQNAPRNEKENRNELLLLPLDGKRLTRWGLPAEIFIVDAGATLRKKEYPHSP
jgi:hypothetical protein